MRAVPNEEGVLSLGTGFGPGRSPEALASDTRERNRIHLAGIEAAQRRGEALRAEESAKEALQRKALATNPFLPLPAADNDEARREVLTALLQAHEAAGAEEQRIATRIAGAVRERSDAEARQACRASATVEAKAKSAAAAKAWLDQDGQGERLTAEPSETMAQAIAAEIAAAHDLEAVSMALAGLREDLAAAQLRVAQAKHGVQAARDRIVAAHQLELVAELERSETRTAELRLSLLASRHLSAESGLVTTPVPVNQALASRPAAPDAFHPDFRTEHQRWNGWRKALTNDPNANFPG